VILAESVGIGTEVDGDETNEPTSCLLSEIISDVPELLVPNNAEIDRFGQSLWCLVARMDIRGFFLIESEQLIWISGQNVVRRSKKSHYAAIPSEVASAEELARSTPFMWNWPVAVLVVRDLEMSRNF